MIALEWTHPSYKANRNKGKFCGFKDEWVTSYPNPSALKNGGVTAQPFEARYTGSMDMVATHHRTKRPKRFIEKDNHHQDFEFVNENTDVNPLYAPIILVTQNDNTTIDTIAPEESFVSEPLTEIEETKDERSHSGGVVFTPPAGTSLGTLRTAANSHFGTAALEAEDITVITDSGSVTGIALTTNTIEDTDYTDVAEEALDASIHTFALANNANVTLGRHQQRTILIQGGEKPQGSKQANLRNIPEFEADGFSFAAEVQYPNTVTQLIPESVVGHAAFLLKIVVKFSKVYHNVEELTISFRDFLDEILDGPKTTASSNVKLYPNGHDRVETFWFNSVLGNIKRPRFEFGVESIQHMPRLGMAIFGMQSGCDVRTGGGGIEQVGSCDSACFGHTTGHVLGVQAFFTV
jgi:hypothetical protein